MVTVYNLYFLFHFTAITDEHVELDRVMSHNHTYTHNILSIKENLVSTLMPPFNLKAETCNAPAGM